MKIFTYLNKLLFTAIALVSFEGFSQCFQIESILVDACSATSPTNDEGFNEMVRFRVGATAINTGTLSVNWPSNAWTGLVQNAVTAGHVAQINAAILAAGNCGQVIQPTGGVLPANAQVLLITSQNFTPNYNLFTSLNSTLYIIFQNNTTTTGGHFGNYNATPGTRTLSITFGGGCTDTVTYERSNLININGTTGGTLAEQDGATVNFTAAGVPSYVNSGCNAPVTPFTVSTAASPNTCVAPGAVVTLTGTASGHQSVAWTTNNGSVPNPTNLTTTYTVPNNATGTITFTLTATNQCGSTISSTVTISIAPPTPTAVPITYCQNAPASPLTATPTTGGTLNWYGTNATGGTASTTAPTPSTAGALGSVVSYYVSQTIGSCESARINLDVIIGNNAPTATPNLFCDAANTTTTQVAFDFNNAGQSSFTYSYTIDGGGLTTGNLVAPSHYNVPVTGPGQAVTFTLTWNGICTPSQTITCYSTCAVTPVLSIHNPAAVCAPNTVNLTAPAVTAGSTGGGTLTYWNDINATMPLGNPAAVSVSGTYYIKSSVGGCSDIEPVVVSINQTPSLIITDPSAVCSPNTVNLTAPAVTAGSTGGGVLTYWTNVAATIPLANPNAVTSTGAYYIKSTVGGVCFDIGQVNVTVAITPVLSITNPPAACSPNTVDITLPAVTAGSTGGGTLTYWTTAAATTPVPNPAAVTAGTYYIKSTNGSCSDIEPVVVVVTTTPVLTITNPATVCSPNTVDITLPAVTAGSTGGGILSYWTTAAATIPLVNPTTVSAGTYYIKSANGACSDIEAVVVSVTTTPVLTITNPSAVCLPNTVNITLPAVTAGSTGGGTLTYWTTAAATTPVPNPTAVSAGTYYIKSTNGTCSDIEPVVVTTAVTPVLNITNPLAVCSPNTVNITLPAVTAGSTGGGTLTYWTTAAANVAVANPTTVSAGTYYIKSTNGNCFDIEPVVVTVNPSPVLNITNPATVCSPNTVDITLPAVTAGSTGGGTLSYWTDASATVALGTPNAISTSGIYYIKSTSGLCFDIKPVTVVIANPNLVITNPTPVCSPATVNLTLPAVTAGSTGVGVLTYWTDALATIPLANPTAVAVGGNYYIKTTVGTCSDIEQVVVTINANFVVNNPTPLKLCDPSNDGLVTFDLTQVITFVTGGNPSYTVTFHETLTDANVGGTSIPTPASYDNIVPWTQTVYIRVTSSTALCYQVVQLQLIVNPTPEATQPTDYLLCDNTAPTGYEVFNLTTKIPEILGSINPALTTVSFYHSLTDAQTPSNVITNITNYTNSIINAETLYVRVETTATGCFDIVTLNLVVNPLPNSTQPAYAQYSLCDVDQSNIGYEIFDLGSKINDILLGQGGMDVTFWPSLGDAQNGTGQILSLLYQNQVQYVQTLGIRITNQATGCYVISTMDIRVEPLPTLTPPTQPYTLCDNNQDGYTTFDLTTLIPGLLSGVSTYALSFHETIIDAQNNGTTIPNPSAYDNINAFVQILYVRAEDINTHCVSITPIVLNVNPSPVEPVLLSDIVVCDTDSNPYNASTSVDLTIRTPDVLAQQPAGSYTVTYYNSQSDAQTPIAPFIPDTNHIGADGDTIWVRVENNATGCFNVGSFQLVINTPLLLSTPSPLSVCDDDAVPNDQLFVFDLTIKNLSIAPAGESVTYYPSLFDAQNNTNAITAPTAYLIQTPPVQTLGVVVTTAQGCKSITTLDIRVLPIPTPRTNPPALAPKCDDNNPGDMLEIFNLTVNESYIANSDPNLTFLYYTSQSLAEAGVPGTQITNPSAALVGGNVWIRVENNRVDYLGNHCYGLVEQALRVDPLPTVIQPLAPYRVCDDNADGIAQFDLTNPVLAPLILGTATTAQQPSDYTITYHATPGNASSGAGVLGSPYTNITPNAENIYIRVVNNATGCVNATGVLPLAVEAYATASGPQIFTDCDNFGDPYDGVHQIDLTQFESAILGGQNPAVFLVSYYRSQTDADAGINPLSAAEELAYTTDPDTDTIWVKVENSSNTITPYCYALTTIAITVERYPNPIINTPNGVNTICVDFATGAVIRNLTLESGITNTAGYTFEWFEAGAPTTVIGTNPTYLVDAAALAGATRSYTVHVTSISALGCDTTSAPFDVIQSGPAVIQSGTIGYTVTNAFSNTQIITVMVDGYGTYEYSLDDGPRQTDPVFEGVSLGTHVIHVWDTEGGIAYSCEELTINDVQIIDYPHYFTPNGDGIHDTWNIVGLGGQPGAKIYIFDRYGKLLKQISSKGEGWNGTYNGALLPSDDYWFTVDFMENGAMKQFKAHFTLKR